MAGGYLFALARSSAASGGGRPQQADDADQILDSLVAHEALDALSPAHGDVLRLAQDEGLTHSQIAGWVLGALDEAEAETIGADLWSCAQCQAEVSELEAVAKALGRMTVPAGMLAV
jgi:hypothetical protein